MGDRVLKVFVSSTSEDLQRYRQAARDEILEVHGLPLMMEYMGALPERSVAACRSWLKQCDVVLLIAAFRRGWVPTREQGGDGQSSITALERAAAKELGKPVLHLMAEESWPGNLWERDRGALEWVEKFRGEIDQPAAFFGPESDPGLPDFRNKVHSALLDFQQRRIEQRLASGPKPVDIEIARDWLAGCECLPFLGPGIYGEGPLSTRQLVQELWPDAPESQACLATAAEFAHRHLQSRGLFLKGFEKVLSNQSKQLERPPAVVELLDSALRRPAFVVSTSYDTVMEDRLAARRHCAIVTHILHAADSVNEGKLLVLEQGQAPKICLADRIDLEGLDLVIYKPLGSPLLHRRIDPALGIDTVVATETDHLRFLERLRNQHMQVPAPFVRQFQIRPILFLGLELDVWHYRLVIHVLREKRFGREDPGSLAVREPASEIERLSWQNLFVSLIELDPNDFARRVMQRPGAAASAFVEEASHV